MLNEHKDLLAQIQLAEEAARALLTKGCRVDESIRLLRQAANSIRDRVAHYDRDAKKAGSSKKAAKEEPAKTGTPDSNE